MKFTCAALVLAIYLVVAYARSPPKEEVPTPTPPPGNVPQPLDDSPPVIKPVRPPKPGKNSTKIRPSRQPRPARPSPSPGSGVVSIDETTSPSLGSGVRRQVEDDTYSTLPFSELPSFGDYTSPSYRSNEDGTRSSEEPGYGRLSPIPGEPGPRPGGEGPRPDTLPSSERIPTFGDDTSPSYGSNEDDIRTSEEPGYGRLSPIPGEPRPRPGEEGHRPDNGSQVYLIVRVVDTVVGFFIGAYQRIIATTSIGSG